MNTGSILQNATYDDLSIIEYIVKIQRLTNPTTMNTNDQGISATVNQKLESMSSLLITIGKEDLKKDIEFFMEFEKSYDSRSNKKY